MLFNDNRLLFIDYTNIESVENIRLKMNPPQKAGPCLCIDKEWELGAIRGLCVIQYNGQHWMYYKAGQEKGPSAYALAVSSDGINWEKPNLGVVEFKGSKDNNIIDIEGDNPAEFCVFIDPSASDAERFKLVAHGNEQGGLYAMYSADGIRFKHYPEKLLRFILDCSNTTFYDERIGKYVIYTRGWNQNRAVPPMGASRTVVRAETDDLSKPVSFNKDASEQWKVAPKWSDIDDVGLRRVNQELPSVIACDEKDPAQADIYQPAATHYLRDIYLAFPTLYYSWPWPPEGFVNDGVLDIQFAASRDGIDWQRDYRGPYAENDLPDGYTSKFMHMLIGMAPNGPIISQYYRGSNHTHGENRTSTEIRTWEHKPNAIGDPIALRLEQRMDGFVSADSAYTGGVLTTRPFTIESDCIKLNINTSASGVAYAALLDENGAVIPGFSLDECDRIQGNDTKYVISWNKGKSDISGLVDRKVKMLIKSRNCKLYAIYP